MTCYEPAPVLAQPVVAVLPCGGSFTHELVEDRPILGPGEVLELVPRSIPVLFLDGGYGFHSNDALGVMAAVDPSPALVRTRGAEVGARSDLLPGVQTSLALWVLELDSELVFAGDAGTTEASRPSRREGVEWSARWQPAS